MSNLHLAELFVFIPFAVMKWMIYLSLTGVGLGLLILIVLFIRDWKGGRLW